ncbi:MAG: M23 family metallopeptidase [Vampirovibrionales bacterium]|nr:M23 family metallopeptidase [Vampirovibrionales bacterium]
MLSLKTSLNAALNTFQVLPATLFVILKTLHSRSLLGASLFRQHNLLVGAFAALALVGSLVIMKAQANSVYYGALNDGAMYEKAQEILTRAGATAKENARLYDALQTGAMEDMPSDLAAQYAGSVLRLTNPTLANALGIETADNADEEAAVTSLIHEFEPLDDFNSHLNDELDSASSPQDGLGKSPDLEKALKETIQKQAGVLEESDSFKLKYIAFANPVSRLSVSSPFGRRHGRSHLGTDFQAPIGTKIQASAAGRVINAGMTGAYGNLVVIDHGNGITTRYAHCSKILVKMGQAIHRGQIIAKVGNTGRSTGPHLHFEITANGTHLNPQSFLPTPGQHTTRTVVMRRGFKKISEL